MEYYAIAGMVLVCLIAISGFFASIKKSLNEDKKPLEDLNLNITKLNINFENMMSQDKIRDKRIDKHGQQIDAISERQKENEKKILEHDIRIIRLEDAKEE